MYSYLHAKDEGKLIRMTLEEARRQGFRECAFCFKKMLYLPDLAVEMEIEKEWSEHLHDYEPLMEGSARQADLNNLGQRILRNWPVALLGYDYSFQLIKSGKMNAIAIPTGKIVVSTTLLEALENEEEREALLVLAIAHIEMRHSLRLYQLQLSASQNSDAMKSLMKAAGSVAGMFPGDRREEPIVEQFLFVRGKLEY
ncbi:M48 family metalloprotease [Thermodesulfobacteriota bacterium]